MPLSSKLWAESYFLALHARFLCKYIILGSGGTRDLEVRRGEVQHKAIAIAIHIPSKLHIFRRKSEYITEHSIFKQSRRSILRIWQAIPIRACIVRPSLKPHPSFGQDDSLECRAGAMPLLSDHPFVYSCCFLARCCHESDVLIIHDRGQRIRNEENELGEQTKKKKKNVLLRI